MESLSPLRRAYYAYLSRAYAMMYTIYYRSILGIRTITLVRWLPILAVLIGWVRGWPVAILIPLLLLVVWINYSLWRAKRDNFNRFVADTNTAIDSDLAEPLPANAKVTVKATGLFSVSGRDNNLLLRPASYWKVPLGEHVVMAEELPGKYLYQFFSAKSLQSIRSGWLLFGRQPIETVAITFLARWGPEYTRFGQLYEDGNDSDMPPPKRLTVYLSAPDEETRRAVWRTIVSDAREARLNL